MKRVVLGLVVVVALAPLCSCAHKKSLLFMTYTKVGISASGTSEGVPIDAEMGYNRFEGAVVPVDETKEEAPSVFASIDLKNKWLRGIQLNQTFATGEASTVLAAKPEAFAATVSATKEVGDKLKTLATKPKDPKENN